MLKKFSFYLLILITFLANVHFTYHHHVCNHSETEMLAQDDCCIAEIKEVEEVCNEDDSCCEVMSHQISFEADFIQISDIQLVILKTTHYPFSLFQETKAIENPFIANNFQTKPFRDLDKHRLQSIFCNFKFHLIA